MAKSEEYLRFLKPILEQALNNKWPDPAQEGFERKYIIDFSRAKAFQEIYLMLENAETHILNIKKQLEKPVKNFSLESSGKV